MNFTLRLTALAALALCFCANNTKAASSCTYHETPNRNYMQKPELDHVGFCSIFALRVLLHQYRCKTDPSNCELPAVLDLIARMDGTELGPRLIYQSLQKNPTIPDEKCLSFGSYFKKDGGTTETLRPLSWNESFTSEISYKLENQFTCEDKKKLTEITQGAGQDLTHFRNYLFSLLKHDIISFEEQNRCYRRSFPSATFVEDLVPKKPDAAERLLKKHLDQGQTVLAMLFIDEPDRKSKNSHVVVVSNYREQCCVGVCVTQYQVIDSLGYYWAPNQSNGWVDSQTLIQALGHDHHETFITLSPPRQAS